MDFIKAYTRFENLEDNRLNNRPPTEDGIIVGSIMNGDDNKPFPPQDSYNPFVIDIKDNPK